jgi:hypothetical protein
MKKNYSSIESLLLNNNLNMIIIFYHECNNQNFEKKYYINENMKFDKIINTYEKNIKNICNCNNKKYYLYDLFKKNIIS